MNNKTKINELEKNLIEELNDNKKEILERQYPEDLVTEFVDGWIPIYNSDLIEAISDDPSLAYVDDHGLLPKNPGVHDIIRAAIYERLSSVGFEWLCDNQKDKEVA